MKKMKRCIICGTLGDDNSTSCEVCGNPFVDTENTSEADKGETPEVQQVSSPAEEKEDTPASKEEEAPKAEEPAPDRSPERARAAAPRAAKRQYPGTEGRPHRTRSGPQIYGQEGSMPQGTEFGRQGAVRRNVQGKPVDHQPVEGSEGTMREEGQTQMRRPVQGQTGRPADPAQGQSGMAGRPAGPVQGQSGMASRQAAPVQGQSGMAGRPAGSMQGQGSMAGRPMNPGQVPMGRPPMQSAGYQSRRIAEVSRKMLKSPLFFLIALLYTASFAGSIAAIFLNQMNYSQVIRLIKNFDLPAQVSGYAGTVISLLSKLDSGAIVANLIIHIPELLFCLGLWLIFICALRAKENMSGVGFGFVKANVIINMIAYFAIMFILLVLSVAVAISSWAAGTTSVIVISAIVLVLVIVATMMVIMFFFCFLATIKACRLNSNEGESYGRLSGYVAVVHIVLGLFAIIDLLSGIVNSEIVNIIGGAGSIGWMLLFAVWIFMYRGRMDELEEDV